MYKKSTIAILTVFAALLFAPRSQADVSVGIAADEDGIKSFHLAIGEHFGAKETEVVYIKNQKITDEDLPVVFFLARHAKVTPDVIVKLRRSGNSWMQIAAQFGLGADLFYVQFESEPGPPYGRAWGRFKKHKRSEWHKVRLVDADVVNLVNLKFAVAHYGCSPTEVVKHRAAGIGFAKFHKQARAAKKNRMKQNKHKARAVASNEHQQKQIKAKKTKGKKKQ